jgi:hypothetical protein
LLGEAKPEGTPTVSTVIPTVNGSNAVSLSASPPEKLRGLTVMEPTLGALDVTGTIIGPIPPRNSWLAAKLRKTGSRRAGWTLNSVFAPPTPTLKFPPGLVLTNPDGASVIVAVSAPKVGAVAVIVAVPVSESAWIANPFARGHYFVPASP